MVSLRKIAFLYGLDYSLEDLIMINGKAEKAGATGIIVANRTYSVIDTEA